MEEFQEFINYYWPDFNFSWRSEIPIVEPPLIQDIKEIRQIFQSEVLYFARLFIHLDFDFKKKFAMAWNSLIEMEFSYQVICFTIIALTVMVLGFLNYPKYRALIRARNCKVEVDWNRNHPNRVGGEVVIKLRQPFLSPSCLPRRLNFPLNETLNDLITNIKMTVFVDQKDVVVTKEVHEEDQSFQAKFSVNVSGKYKVFLSYCGFPVTGSPFTAVMEADDMDISKSYLETGNPIVIVKNKQFKIDVIPVDMYGNRCNTTLDSMRRLRFDVKRSTLIPGSQSQHHTSNASVNDMDDSASKDFQFTTGIRRQNPEHSDFLPIYSIYGKCEDVGNFVGKVYIDEVPLTRPNPWVELISISGDEEEMVQELKCDGLCQFEGRLIFPLPVPAQTATGTGTLPKIDCETEEDVGVRDVSLELSTRFLFLSERVLGGPFEKRLECWRIGNNTKVEIASIQNEPEPDIHIMKISNITSNSVREFVMKGRDARIFLVMFYEYLAGQRNASQIPTISSEYVSLSIHDLAKRQKKLYQGIRNSFEMNCEVHLVLPNFRTFTVTRADIVETTLQATEPFTRYDWGKPFIVSFRHEPMNRSGATWVDWAEELGKEFFESSIYGMFLGNNSTIGNRQRPGLLHPNPNRNNRWNLKHYELAGKLVGKCLVEKALNPQTEQCVVDARFSRTIYAMILGILPTYKHLQIDDPDYFQSNFETVLQNDVTSMGLHFVIRNVNGNGNVEIHELIPNGANTIVTNENKITYLNQLAKFRLIQNVTPEIRAFTSGLNLLIPGRLLMMFDENELEIVLCGSSPLNLKNLIQYYHGSENNWGSNFDKVKNWLRNALEGMDYLDLGRFYQFVTGSSRLPKEGFIALRPSIGMSALFGQMPSANKAQCHLTVTDHPSYESFLNSLLAAIRKNDFD